MQNIIFAFLLIGLNILLFLLLNVNFKIDININKKRLLVLLFPVIVVIIVFLIVNPEKYRVTFYMSAALFCLMSLRFIMYKLLSLPPENENKGRRILRKIFDSVLFPIFVLFISFAQCMFLFVWNS